MDVAEVAAGDETIRWLSERGITVGFRSCVSESRQKKKTKLRTETNSCTVREGFDWVDHGGNGNSSLSVFGPAKLGIYRNLSLVPPFAHLTPGVVA